MGSMAASACPSSATTARSGAGGGAAGDERRFGYRFPLSLLCGAAPSAAVVARARAYRKRAASLSPRGVDAQNGIARLRGPACGGGMAGYRPGTVAGATLDADGT